MQVEVVAGREPFGYCAAGVRHQLRTYGDSILWSIPWKDPNGVPYRGVRQQFVKLAAPRRPDGPVSGVKPGDEVVTSGVFKLRNGAAVLVNNKVQPGTIRPPKLKKLRSETVRFTDSSSDGRSWRSVVRW